MLRKDWRLITEQLSDRLERADVIPNNDARLHVRGKCWCEPRVERVYFETRLRFLVAHHATDARELTEQTGVN